MNATKILSVLIGGVLGAICAGITAYLLGSPFASAAVGFVWCFAGYYIGRRGCQSHGAEPETARRTGTEIFCRAGRCPERVYGAAGRAEDGATGAEGAADFSKEKE